jgi:uncharacterized protein (DUF433 family)
MPVATIFENLEDGLTIQEIMEQFDVTREQVTAVLDFAARSLEQPIGIYAIRICKAANSRSWFSAKADGAW